MIVRSLITHRMTHELLMDVLRLYPVVRALRDAEGPVTQRSLSAQCDVSKSAIHRNINTLEGMGMVQRDNGGHCLTNLGTVVADETGEYVSRVDAVMDHSLYLDAVVGGGLTVDDIISGSVTWSDSRDGLLGVPKSLISGENVRILANTPSVWYTGFDIEELDGDDQQVEIVVGERIVAWLCEDAGLGSKLFGEENGTLDIQFSDEEFPYELWMSDERLCLGVADGGDSLVAILETESDSALAWAREVFEQTQKRAEGFSLEAR